MWTTKPFEQLIKNVTTVWVVPRVVHCAPQEMSVTWFIGNPCMSVWLARPICKCKWIPITGWMKEAVRLTAVLPARLTACLVSTWWNLRTRWRMFLDRGLPRKINLCLTSSASGGIPWPPHLTQCSYHKHKHHAWVVMQEKGTLFGVWENKRDEEKEQKPFMLVHHCCWISTTVTLI